MSKQYHYVGCVLKTFHTSFSVYIYDRADRIGYNYFILFNTIILFVLNLSKMHLELMLANIVMVYLKICFHVFYEYATICLHNMAVSNL